MKETARNGIPIHGIIKNTGFPCYELYVTKSLFLTECRNDLSSSPVILSVSEGSRALSTETLRFAQGDPSCLHSYFVEHGEVNEEITTLTQRSGH